MTCAVERTAAQICVAACIVALFDTSRRSIHTHQKGYSMNQPRLLSSLTATNHGAASIASTPPRQAPAQRCVDTASGLLAAERNVVV